MFEIDKINRMSTDKGIHAVCKGCIEDICGGVKKLKNKMAKVEYLKNFGMYTYCCFCGDDKYIFKLFEEKMFGSDKCFPKHTKKECCTYFSGI